MKYKLLMVSIISVVLWNCTNSREDYIKKIIGSELVINYESMFKSEDSVLYLSDIKKPLKIVVYSDSSNCNACDMQFATWKIRFRELNHIANDNIGLIFIINTKNISDMELNARIAQITNLRLYDTQGVFKKNNHVFNHRDLHTFLLDQNNKVILVGDPLVNHQLFDIYKRAIEKYIPKTSTTRQSP